MRRDGDGWSLARSGSVERTSKLQGWSRVRPTSAGRVAGGSGAGSQQGVVLLRGQRRFDAVHEVVVGHELDLLVPLSTVIWGNGDGPQEPILPRKGR